MVITWGRRTERWRHARRPIRYIYNRKKMPMVIALISKRILHEIAFSLPLITHNSNLCEANYGDSAAAAAAEKKTLRAALGASVCIRAVASIITILNIMYARFLGGRRAKGSG